MVEVNVEHASGAPPASVAAAAAAAAAGVTGGVVFNPSDQLHDIQFCVHSTPSWPEAIILAFQHYIVMLGTTVMISTLTVPLMGGDHGDNARVIQTLVFMSGINTFLQTLFGSRLPTVMGGSFAFVIPVVSIIHDFSLRSFTSEHQRFLHTIRAIQGSLIVTSFLNIILGYSRAWGAYTRHFSPVVIIPVVCVVGLGLFERGFPQVGKCVEIGLPTLIVLVGVQQHLKHVHPRAYPVLDKFALLFCVVLVWSFAALLTVSGAYNKAPAKTKQHCRVDRSYLVSSAPWIRFPYPFQWGPPIFNAGHVFGMIGAALVSNVESSGAFYAASRLSGATPPPANVLSRSIGLQGINTLLDGIFGSPVGSTVSVENVGLLGLTKVGSRRVVQISTAFMVFFSIFGKFGALFASIPLPIFAAIYCVLFGFVAAVGVSYMQFTNNNSMRNLYIIGLSMFLAISIPQYFNEFYVSAGHGPVKTGAGWFDDILNSVFASSPTVALIVGTLLDNTLEAVSSVRDRGLSWWLPFQREKGDVRNEEFYRFPVNFHDFIPARYLY
ncbi:nucleobase-ascorbate transporter 3 [Nymphaea colorata]|nr:nucleobase-ascorbate transporter 3 [Nymphaea colorata]